MLKWIPWKILEWWYKPPTGIRVVKVLAIDDDMFEYIKWNAEAFAGEGWQDAIEQEVGKPLSKNGRMEIRYLDGTTKKRRILYPGDTCDPTFPKPPRVVYLSAFLVPRDGSDHRPLNVMTRMQKYHGSTVACASHMFPFDDDDQLKETYSHIKTIDLFFSTGNISFEIKECPT
jgi:hypothetical protein